MTSYRYFLTNRVDINLSGNGKWFFCSPRLREFLWLLKDKNEKREKNTMWR